MGKGCGEREGPGRGEEEQEEVAGDALTSTWPMGRSLGLAACCARLTASVQLDPKSHLQVKTSGQH